MSAIEKLIQMKGGIDQAAKAMGVTPRSLFSYKANPDKMPDNITALVDLLIQEERIIQILHERHAPPLKV
jgi:hypothetical protein